MPRMLTKCNHQRLLEGSSQQSYLVIQPAGDGGDTGVHSGGSLLPTPDTPRYDPRLIPRGISWSNYLDPSVGSLYPAGEGTPSIPLTRVHTLQYAQLLYLLLPYLDPSSTDEGLVKFKVLAQAGLPQFALQGEKVSPLSMLLT